MQVRQNTAAKVWLLKIVCFAITVRMYTGVHALFEVSTNVSPLDRIAPLLHFPHPSCFYYQ